MHKCHVHDRSVCMTIGNTPATPMFATPPPPRVGRLTFFINDLNGLHLTDGHHRKPVLVEVRNAP